MAAMATSNVIILLKEYLEGTDFSIMLVGHQGDGDAAPVIDTFLFLEVPL